jgi:hypothetical protein
MVDLSGMATEYIEGEWVVPGDFEPMAVVMYAEEPSPETGHVGWCWWALGAMGDAETYEEAKQMAEDSIRSPRWR